MSEYKTNSNGTKEWYNLNDQYHREDGPAIEGANGDKAWYINGQLHREDGHSYELSDASKAWYINGQRHREDGPAFENANGTKEWWVNGNLHREGDKPAVIYSKLIEKKEWWWKGKRHREAAGKPAIVCSNGHEEWWVDDIKLEIPSPKDRWEDDIRRMMKD